MHHATLVLLIALLLLSVACAVAQPGPAGPAGALGPPGDGMLLPDLRPILPADIYAVPGVETNVYFDNIVLHPHSDMMLWDVDCDLGAQQTERWTAVPIEGQVGDHALTIRIVSPEAAVLHEMQTTVHVVPPTAGAGREITVLCVGDSLTNASSYTQRLVELFSQDQSVNATLIGENGPGGDSGNRHEGYGGWTWDGFVNRWDPEADWKDVNGTRRRVRSPFLFEVDGQPKLDFQRYLDKNNDGRPPDFITILLGCNDTFSSDETNIEERIDAMFGNMETLLAEFRRVAPGTPIGVLYLVPPAASQDAFGANYKCSQTRWQYRRNQHRVVEREMQTCLGREAENIFMVPAFVSLDTVWGFPAAMAPPNPYSSDTVRRMSNGVHPAQPGYYQIGDGIYCWIKSRLAQ